MSQFVKRPDGESFVLPEPLLPVDRNAAARVWDEALCAEVDPEIFFPDRGSSPDDAKRICGGCSVRELCLATFGPVMEYGVIGGLTAQERREMLAAARHQSKKGAA